VNNAATRWPKQATKAPAHRQRVNRPIAALQVIATRFVMNAMFRRRSRQLKMPRPDAYEPSVRLVPIHQAVATKSDVTFGGPLAGKIRLEEGFFDPVADDQLLGVGP